LIPIFINQSGKGHVWALVVAVTVLVSVVVMVAKWAYDDWMNP
jgi:hypothetical protein